LIANSVSCLTKVLRFLSLSVIRSLVMINFISGYAASAYMRSGWNRLFCWRLQFIRSVL